ncbi:E3 ubiquitin-protein ligase rnf213-alpha-like [Arapaima gigas]
MPAESCLSTRTRRRARMKCPECGHVLVDLAPKFCSECGCRLPPLRDPSSTEKPPPTPQDKVGCGEKEEIKGETTSQDGKAEGVSPKRPSEEPSDNIKNKRIKKKKKKRKNKKKDVPNSPMAQQVTSDLSQVSLKDKKTEMQERTESFDSEGSDAMDEAPDSFQDSSGPSSLAESWSEVSEKYHDISAQDKMDANQTEPSKLLSMPVQQCQGEDSQALTLQDSQIVKDADLLSPKKQTPKVTLDAPAASPTNLHLDSRNPTSQMDLEEEIHAADQRNNQAHSKVNETKKDAESSQQPKTDRNANMDQCGDKPSQTQHKMKTTKQSQSRAKTQPAESQQVLEKPTESKASGKGTEGTDQVKKQTESKPNTCKKNGESSQETHTIQQVDTLNENRQKKIAAQKDTTGKAECAESQQMVFGPQRKTETPGKTSSIIQKSKKEKGEVKRSANPKGNSATPSSQTPEKDKEPGEQKSQKSKTTVKKTNVSSPTSVPSTNEIPAAERLTIYFHAVLSKDFKLNPEEDFVFLRAGGPLASWDSNLAQLYVSRDLGEHGFYVEGKLVTSKSVAASVSIPYKYVVYKSKKDTTEFEYIYKSDATGTANRCLFVKSHLLNQEGEWHQYDDIICAEPSKGVMQWLKDKFLSEQHNVVEGRNIAGKIMLETIFELLSTWSATNLKSFFCQLKQFQEVYANPSVYEDKPKKWSSLDYGKREVNNLMKELILEKVLPELQKESEGKTSIIKNSLKAAVIVLYVTKEYSIQLNHGELSRLSTLLCLQKMPKEEFLVYWADLVDSLSYFKDLSEMAQWLINNLISCGLQRWVQLIPLLHFLRRTSAPFEPVQFVVNPNYSLSWAGLEGVKLPVHLGSHERRALMRFMKENVHLTKTDQLLPRSWMYLVSLDHLADFISFTPVDLLESLHAFVYKSPADIGYTNFEVLVNVIYFVCVFIVCSCYTEDYGTECLATAVKLLQKLCTGVKSPTAENFTTIPMMCVSLVTSVSDFASCYGMQGTKDSSRGELSAKHIQLLTEAMKIMRNWISKTFKDRILKYQYLSSSLASDIKVWNSIISVSFASKDFTEEWRKTFTTDLEGKIQKESSLDQIEMYCSNFDKLNQSLPYVAESMEKCALLAVNSICQVWARIML